MSNYTPEERKAERRARACTGKRVFDTYEQAHNEAKRLRKRFKMKMRAYHCKEFCGNYHIGHNRHGSRKTYLELQEVVDHQREYGH